MVVSRSLPHKSVCTSPTRLKNLSGDTEVSGTVRYCHWGYPFGTSRETLPDAAGNKLSQGIFSICCLRIFNGWSETSKERIKKGENLRVKNYEEYSRFRQTCLLRGFTFTFTVRIIVQFLYQDGHVWYKPSFSVFVPHVTVLLQKLRVFIITGQVRDTENTYKWVSV
jgi:hypothetical protein